VDEMCRGTLNTLYAQTENLLREDVAMLIKLSNVLAEREVLTGKEIDEILHTAEKA